MIQIQNLKKSFDKRAVLKGVNFDVSSGKLFALSGPNGSGKSTLLKCLLGTVLPDAGSSVRISGKDVLRDLSYKQDVTYMPQFPHFPAHLKVSEIIALFETLRTNPAIFKEQLVEELGIAHFWDQSFGTLSGGMSQKVNILQCFMFDAPLAILDEPSQGLDPAVSFYLKQWIKKDHQRGKTILFTSHMMSEVEELAEEMALLVEGKLYALTSPKSLILENKAENLEQALQQFWVRDFHEK